ncbi:MAG: class I SAM-dependent methyltransferase [bacterium]
METHSKEIRRGERFEFGKNWRAFLATLDEDRIREAENSLRKMLERETLAGKKFLDIGSGSGLFSLAARRLGARVCSFDFDPQSVACTHELRRRYSPTDEGWRIEQGSALDEEFLSSLGQFDIVYSWGVLHHTGDMWRAVELASRRVCEEGILLIALYNDQGGASRRWLEIKRLYNRLPGVLRAILVFLIASFYESKYALVRMAKGKNPLPFGDWKKKKKDRGMSVWHDWVDWCGGLPFEVAKPEQVIVPLRKKGFILENLSTCGGGWGCNQYVFRRRSS